MILIFAASLVPTEGLAGNGEKEAVCIRCSLSSASVISEMWRESGCALPNGHRVVRPEFGYNLEKTTAIRDCDAVATRMPVEISVGRKADSVVVGWRVVSIVVNLRSQVSGLTMREIGGIFGGEIQNWSEVGGADGAIALVGQGPRSQSYEIIQRECVAPRRMANVTFLADEAEVAEFVRRTPGAIGFLLREWDDLDRVKELSVRSIAETEPVTATTSSLSGEEYPLVEPVILSFIGDGPESIRCFVDFLATKGAADVARRHALFPEFELREFRRTQREAEYRRGDGPTAGIADEVPCVAAGSWTLGSLDCATG